MKIPLADAGALSPFARRTVRVLAAFALLVAASVLAAVFVSRHPHSHKPVSLPKASNAIVVLDLSASISPNTFKGIGGTLAPLAKSGGRYGLVVFSDQAYEALPPGTPAADLQPMLRYFTAQKGPRGKPVFPQNPWNNSFSAGTSISSGLGLGHTLAVQAKSHPTVILVSDLEDNTPDIPRLVGVIQAYHRDHIPLRIVGLDPTRADAALFRKLTAGVPITKASLAGGAAVVPSSTPFPWLLVVLALLAAGGLAAGELWAPRLEWGR
jgi:hypothetical protein